MIKQFLPFAQEKMGFKKPPKLFLRGSAKNAANPLGKTAFYDPAAKAVTLYITDRHPKDVMRSLSHELVHHTQNCRGDFNNVGEMGEGYAQNDEHLREMEREAYEVGNMCFRDWEDSIKSTIYFEHLQKGVKTMSTKEWKNKELTSILSEAFGFKFSLDNLNEAKEADPKAFETEELSENEEELTEVSADEEGTEDVHEKPVAEMYGRHGNFENPYTGGHGHDEPEPEQDEAEAHAEKRRRPKPPEEELEEGGLADRPENDDKVKPHRGRRGKGAVSEDQIREVARRILARMQKEEKNG